MPTVLVDKMIVIPQGSDLRFEHGDLSDDDQEALLEDLDEGGVDASVDHVGSALKISGEFDSIQLFEALVARGYYPLDDAQTRYVTFEYNES